MVTKGREFMGVDHGQMRYLPWNPNPMNGW